jgi:hypothetical protein
VKNQKILTKSQSEQRCTAQKSREIEEQVHKIKINMKRVREREKERERERERET